MTYRASNDVCDVHQMIVNDIGKMVGWKTVRLDENKVILVLPLLETAVRQIDKARSRDGVVSLEAYDMLLAAGSAFVGFISTDCPACPRIASGSAGVEGLKSGIVQTFG